MIRTARAARRLKAQARRATPGLRIWIGEMRGPAATEYTWTEVTDRARKVRAASAEGSDLPAPVEVLVARSATLTTEVLAGHRAVALVEAGQTTGEQFLVSVAGLPRYTDEPVFRFTLGKNIGTFTIPTVDTGDSLLLETGDELWTEAGDTLDLEAA